ncbi:MAG: hypothetical protein R3321_05725 [Nitrososphaeraceae archaeon]|nr:hypothetical protein [Nitrososphaeraceae archaeon]
MINREPVSLAEILEAISKGLVHPIKIALYIGSSVKETEKAIKKAIDGGYIKYTLTEKGKVFPPSYVLTDFQKDALLCIYRRNYDLFDGNEDFLIHLWQLLQAMGYIGLTGNLTSLGYTTCKDLLDSDDEMAS